MAITGDTVRLSSLAKEVRKMGRDFARDVTANLAEEARHQVVTSFETSTDPYGMAWRPSRGRHGELRTRGQILRDTGRLLASFRVASNSLRFSITSNVEYAAIHNYGGTVSQHARSQTNVHDYGGKLISRKAASEAAASSMRVSFSRIGARQLSVYRRQFIPDTNDLGPTWTAAFDEVISDMLNERLGRK